MRIIFSRKGFDSASGGAANPIFPDGGLCYIPIPSDHERLRYGQIAWEGRSLGAVVADVTGGRLGPQSGVHLDPDIDPDAFAREPGWRPLFGQTGAAQSHLENQGVREGDVFLFFGWFRRARPDHGRLAYVPDAPDLHVLFGWIQIECIRKVDGVRPHELTWARYHPHFGWKPDRLNTVYLATRTLALPGLNRSLPGAGVFRRFSRSLCLTSPGSLRSRWRLPQWFHPRGSRRALSYHSGLARWQLDKDCVHLNTVPRGQEFVLDCDDYPEAAAWLGQLFEECNP